jgi:BNR repeat-containing family member
VKSRCHFLICLLAVLAATAITARAATVSLKTDDASGTSSFTGSTNWNNNLPASAANDYLNAAHTLRTPVGSNVVAVFGGGSLTITGVGGQAGATAEALLFKGSGASGLLTVSNLTINGGELRNASGTADSFNLQGNILTVGAAGMVVHMQGPIIVSSPVAGSGGISIIASGTSSGNTLHFASASNTFTGNISLVSSTQSRFALDAGANLNFVIGSAGINNAISGSGLATFDGAFNFNLTAASTNVGDSWTIEAVTSPVFDSTFSVGNFARSGGGTGSGVWQATNNGAYYSFDTTSGILQVMAQPTNAAAVVFTNSHVAFLRDSVVVTNACLMANTGSYGRAINGISFQKDGILLTFAGYQYTAWYDNTNSTQNVWLARRPVTNTSVGAWEKFNTGSTFVNGKASWDAHCVITIGICPVDGTLHLAWDHHDNTLRYRRSVAGLCTTNKAAWGAGALNAEQNWLVTSATTESDVTYPQFTITPAGGLIFNRRMGVSGNGDQYFQIYNPATGAWNAKVQFINRAGTYVGVDPFGTTRTCTERCAYLNGLDIATNGTMHVTWTWRESASQYGNRDICYAYSTNNGVTWLNNGGTNIADTSLGQTITQGSPGITIVPLDMRQLLINQQAQCVDNAGRVHVLMLHRRQEAGYEPSVYSAQFSTKFTAYYHYWRDPATGIWSQQRIPPDVYPPGSRPKIGFDAAGNVYAVFVSYPAGTAVTPGYSNGQLVVASATKAAQYTNWTIVQALNIAFDGEPLLDQARLLADNILAVYLQEHSATTSVVGTPLHAYEFAVNVPTPNSLAMNFSGPDTLVSLNASAGHNYKLQSVAALPATNWADVGVIVTNNVSGLLALPDANGRGANRKFYRVVTDP